MLGGGSTPTYGLTDSQSAKTTSASEDRGFDGGKKVKGRKRHFEKYSTIQRFCGDDGYRKSFEEAVLEQLGLGVDISKRIKPKFEVLPLRWKVERTFSWANHSRRLSKDYEINTKHEENMFIISHLHTLLKRY